MKKIIAPALKRYIILQGTDKRIIELSDNLTQGAPDDRH